MTFRDILSRLAPLVISALCLAGPAIATPAQFEAPFRGYFLAEISTARGLITGDFNEDGRMDLAISAANGAIAVRLGDGAGGFGPMTGTAYEYETSTAIECGDLDRDSHLDLVVAQSTAPQVLIYRGTGQGTFDPAVALSASDVTKAVFLEDFNEDGLLDLVAACGLSYSRLGVWMGLGNGTFGPRTDLEQFMERPSAVIAADLNEDGHYDIVYTDLTIGSLRFYPGNGDGTFGTMTTTYVSAFPQGLACGDANLDSHLDCIVANTDDNSVSICLGDGSGAFTKTRLQVGGKPWGVTLGDFDADGLPDVAVVNHGGGNPAGYSVAILRNTGSGSFVRQADIPVVPSPRAVQATDLDGDGRLDLVIASDGRYLTTLFGNGDGTFGSPTFDVGTNPTALAAGDMNGDGRPDVVTVNEYDGTLSLRLGQPGRAFGPRLDVSIPSQPQGVAVGDLDEDGARDVVVTAADVVSVFRGDGAGHLAPRIDIPVTGWACRPVLVDLNRDGHLDLVMGSMSASSVTVLTGNGAGGFAAPVGFATPAAPFGICAPDLNGDGWPDLVTANSDPGNISVFLSNGAGGFAPRVDYSAGSRPFDLAAGDLDGDGILDLAVTNGQSHTVSIFRGDGGGSGVLVRMADVAAGPNPQGIVILDVNADGHLDLAVAAAGGSMASIHYGYGDGTFAPRDEYGSGSTCRAIVSADFNMDGTPDLALANYGNPDAYTGERPGSFAVLWNRSEPPVAIELLAFQAVRSADGVRVTWEVGDGAIRHIFSVFREVGGRDRVPVEAGAVLTGLSRYEVLDAGAPPLGDVKYWLRDSVAPERWTWYGPYPVSDVSPVAVRLDIRPNPARGPVTLTFDLPASGSVRLEVFDASGRMVARPVDGALPAGTGIATWNRRLADGREAAPGLYFLRLRTPSGARTGKLLLK